MSLTFVQKLKFEKKEAVVLVRSTDEEGDNYWLYLRMDRSAYDAFDRKMNAGQAVRWEDYGKIIASGWGDDPTEEERETILSDYEGA